jgi:membrane-bound lytic murein transglycosylase A
MSNIPLWRWQFSEAERLPMAMSPVAFAGIDGWAEDDHAAALAALRLSLMASDELSELAEWVHALGDAPSREDARRFFEANFTPHLVTRQPEGAIVTGYFEPELRGSLEPTPEFGVPVYGLPSDLVLITAANRPEGWPADLTGARETPTGLAAYFTRREIEAGALAGRGLELLYLNDHAECFVMHVQGSGLVRLPDGRGVRLGFSGKNGHPYTSIGKVLVQRGELNAANATLDALLAWIRADPERGRQLIWENASFIFFHIRPGEADGPSAHGVPLTAGRSLAVDPRYHQLGLPIWVEATGLADAAGQPFRRLMIAQDTGSAIRGPVRGDIFWGSGGAAGRIAGATKHPCNFIALIPN